MSVFLKPHHLEQADAFVARAHANGGLAQVDVERFWEDQAVARRDPFGDDIPQVPLGAICNWECVFEELGVPQQWRRWREDETWRLEMSRAYNDKAEQIVGRRLLPEDASDPEAPAYPPLKALHDVFEMENVWDDVGQSYWLTRGANSADELVSLLDRVDERLRDLRAFLVPAGWDEDRTTLMARGIKPPLYRGQRGPVTFACSLLGVEELIFLILDNPPLAERLRDAILRVMLEMIRIQDEEAGYTPETAPRGFGFADDNCQMLTADMYEFFALPIVQGIWERCSPDPEDGRNQHSDSDMGHIIPVLARCDLTSANFGPNITVAEIRRHMPRAAILGQLAPFTYSRNEEVNMVAEFLRDFEMAREHRGLVFATAGSINNGSRLTGMRLLMGAIQEFGRYDR